MSTIRVDNFGPSAGGTTYSANGVARALLLYDQVANSVLSSSNISSVTDDATGRFTPSLTSAFSNTDFYTVVIAGHVAFVARCGLETGSARTTSTAQYYTLRPDTAASFDCDHDSVALWGDLA